MPEIKHLFVITMLSAATSVPLSGCGGGGGGGDVASDTSLPTAAEVIITDANAGTVASSAVSSLSSGQVSNSFSSVSSSVPTGAEIQSSGSVSGSYSISDALRNALEVAKAKASDSAVSAPTGVQITGSQACSGGGSVSLTASVQDQNAPFYYVGDYATATFNHCIESPVTLNGQFYFRVDKHTVDQNLNLTEDAMTIRATNFSLKDSTSTYSTSSLALTTDTLFTDTGSHPHTFQEQLTGAITVSTGLQADTISYAPLAMVEKDGAWITGAAYDWQTVANGLYSVSGVGAIGVNTIVPIENCDIGSTNTACQGLESDYPIRGQLKISGAKGVLLLTASQSFLTMQLDADDNGVYEQCKDVPWTSIDNSQSLSWGPCT